MREDFQSFLRSSLSAMLRPLADFCIARGLRFQDFVDIAKRAFVVSAERRLIRERREVSVSKVSVMSGIQRPEVNRILKAPHAPQSKDFIVRVMGQWTSDKRFSHKKKPKRLGIEGAQSGFAKLVAAVSTDLNPHTVRFEFERLGLIEVKDGHATLLNPVYVTTGDPKETLRRGAGDVEDLLVSLQENAFAAHHVPNLQARTEYDNVPDEALPAIREWLLEMGARLHEQARNFLSKFDRDTGKQQSRGSGRNRVVIVTYSRVEEMDNEKSNEEEK